MPTHESGISRRSALGLFGATAAGTAAPALIGSTPAGANPAHQDLSGLTTGSATTPVQGLHLQFGADPTSQMVVSWITDQAVKNPRVVYGTLTGGLGKRVQARTKTYVDGTSQRTVWVHHAAIDGLQPDTDYLYAAQHDGATPDSGTFRTAPRGRAAVTFTSFGDQAVPSTTWSTFDTTGAAAFNANTTPASGDIVVGIEKVAPLFHLLNGDLCYANLDIDRVRVWNEFFTNNTRSARFRPWMPAAGNHEIEQLNGPLGFGAFQTYFELPSTETDAELDNLWYAFTVGSVRVIVVQNDDNALQDGGDYYVSGYSAGRQLKWLENQLAAARRSRDIDWIVVMGHQVMVSSSNANGADLGLRQKYGPLFDKYEVDLVLVGHEHDYERSLAVRGVVSGSETLTPNPASSATDVIDSEHGTVHMVLGGGGVSGTTNGSFFNDDFDGQGHFHGKVIVAVADSRPSPTGKRAATYVNEAAIWSAVRDNEHPYGFASFTVDPGRFPGDTTKIHVTYYNVNKPDGHLSIFEQFTLQRRRSDGHR
jgi:Purple acid Phosphatase, N-terminal domain/Calcineurin-like phosphoesterase